MTETEVELAVAINTKPKRKTLFIWRQMDGEAVLFNPATNETYLLNQTGAAIWELCDGVHSIEDITDAIAEKFEAGKAEILKDTVEFVKVGQREGYILISE